MLKLLFSIFSGLVLIAALVVGGLTFFVNPNDFKSLIVNEIKKSTGRELAINGDITWQFFPQLGLSVENVALKNPEGFDENNLFTLRRAELSVNVLPILFKRIEIGVVKMHGSNVFVQTLADGKNNLSFVPENEQEALRQGAAAEKDQTSSIDGWSIVIGGLDIQKASVTVKNDQLDSLMQLNSFNLSIGKLTENVSTPMLFELDGIKDQMTFSLKGQADASLQKDLMASEFENVEFDVKANDKNFSLEGLSVTAGAFALNQSSLIEMNVSGRFVKTNGESMRFENDGQVNVFISSDFNKISATGLALNARVLSDTLPEGMVRLGLNGSFSYDKLAKYITVEKLNAQLNEIDVAGKASIKLNEIPEVRFTLTSQEIDFDKWLGEPDTTALTTSEVKVSATEKVEYKAPILSHEEPDLSVLKGLDIGGEMTISRLILNKVKADRVQVDFAIKQGKAQINKFNADFYEGSISTNAWLDVNQTPATYSVKNTITGVEIAALLTDATGKGFLHGKGNIGINLDGEGLSAYNLRKNVKGKLGVKLEDGAVEGFNIAAMLREAKAGLKGKKVDYIEEVRKTDFSALEMIFKLGDGFATIEELKAEAPLLRVHGEGKANLMNELLDFRLFISVVGSSKGQGGKNIDELKDLTVPVKLEGPWIAPTYKIDFKSLLLQNTKLEDKLKNKAEEGLQKLLGDNANNEDVKRITENLLNGLFK